MEFSTETGVGAMVISLVTLAAKFAYNKLNKPYFEQSEDAILATHEVYRILNKLSHATQCDRCTISYTSNGGGIPNVANNLYATILYEVLPVQKYKPIRDLIQSILVDECYIENLNNVISFKDCMVKTSEMKSGFTKTLNEVDNLEYSRLITIYRNKKCFYYLTLSWENYEFTEEQINEHNLEINSAVAKISAIFRKNKNV